MKRITAVLLLAALLMAAAGCFAEAAPEKMTCEGLAGAVLASAEFRELTDMTERYVEKYLILSAEDLDEWVFKRDATRGTPEMILLLKVKAGADQALIRQSAQELLEEQRLQYRDYQPGEMFKLEAARVLENGPFLALIVSPDAAASYVALGEGWKE